ncbi:MAG: hypothetical protein F6J93_19325 [Oscillatoria sp. SIO1A7]|nr:hypothetical protein [Oscillatoria sp. SIO1A7]
MIWNAAKLGKFYLRVETQASKPSGEGINYERRTKGQVPAALQRKEAGIRIYFNLILVVAIATVTLATVAWRWLLSQANKAFIKSV